MAKVNANGIQIEYETFGDSSSPALLLIAGFNTQMLGWGGTFCNEISKRGYYVIRYDNRDIGLSTKLNEESVPDINKMLGDLMEGKQIEPPYTIEDMADDAIGLLNALHIKQAHICGTSMGGFIAQTIAIKQPSLVLSLISIYSHTGNPELPPPKPEVLDVIMAPAPKERDAYIEFVVKQLRAISGSGIPFDEDYNQKIVAKAYDRSFYPNGAIRHLAAVLAQENRKSKLAMLNIPTLVIHGDEDPLVPFEGGKDTADTIPNAEFLVIKGMGHELPKMDKNWSEILDAMDNHMRR